MGCDAETKAKLMAFTPLVKSKLNFTWYFPSKQHLALEICAWDVFLQQDSALEKLVFLAPVNTQVASVHEIPRLPKRIQAARKRDMKDWANNFIKQN